MLNIKQLLTATYDDRTGEVVSMRVSPLLVNEHPILRADVLHSLLARLEALYDQTLRDVDAQVDAIVHGTTLTPTAARTVAQLAGA